MLIVIHHVNYIKKRNVGLIVTIQNSGKLDQKVEYCLTSPELEGVRQMGAYSRVGVSGLMFTVTDIRGGTSGSVT